MLEGCTWQLGGSPNTPIYQIATMFGIPPDSGYFADPKNLSDAAMNDYIEPLFSFLKRHIPEEIHAAKESNMSEPIQFTLDVFISHSSKDEKLVQALIDLLRTALNITAEKIRCTSIDGYRLPIGTPVEQQLRVEVRQSKAFIALVTPSSVASGYAMFEFGARWGAQLYLAPLLGAGADSSYLRGFLGSLNALTCDEAGQIHQLIDDLAATLGVKQRTPAAAYQSKLEALVGASKAGKAPKEIDRPNKASADELPSLPAESTKMLQLIANGDILVDREGFGESLKLSRAQVAYFLDQLMQEKLIFQTSSDEVDVWRATSKGLKFLAKSKLL
jgi:TIR domain